MYTYDSHFAHSPSNVCTSGMLCGPGSVRATQSSNSISHSPTQGPLWGCFRSLFSISSGNLGPTLTNGSKNDRKFPKTISRIPQGRAWRGLPCCSKEGLAPLVGCHSESGGLCLVRRVSW